MAIVTMAGAAAFMVMTMRNGAYQVVYPSMILIKNYGGSDDNDDDDSDTSSSFDDGGEEELRRRLYKRYHCNTIQY